ncbi:Ankyrin repeat domain containing protein [Balamuthia mandrillaris]
MFKLAAKAGHVDILRWLQKKGCPWDATTCKAAAVEGNLDALKWLRFHGCPWDERVFLAAAKSGRLAVVHWLHHHGCPMPEDLLSLPELSLCTLTLLNDPAFLLWPHKPQ